MELLKNQTAQYNKLSKYLKLLWKKFYFNLEYS